ncbi:GNAT family N-acetyltransferase [Aquimarina sp. TRL1]|uniref:bifunctional helix-turn-helix transcriptional regulator/GNAT family N-acetyltransferase n=1 Tax=Aquimarina sp. (strain TRL1) TaxID=2736252 RepID=UPI00158D386A|nr:GNAT family N-acetyltransferase [Aquimarina sp. TRL1]QKX03456.1 GNAT family N-acetyltransferase [Aquimarina sp. TRL1]
MNFFERVGKMALGTRLRMLSELLMDDAKLVYDMYGVSLKPKWFPVFYVISQEESASITEIAKEIGHSHPSVSKTVKEMIKEGILKEKKDQEDGRRTILLLSEKGKEIAITIKDQYIDVENAVEEMLKDTRHNIWKAIEELEYLVEQQSMVSRVMKQKKIRESKNVKIIPYEGKYKEDFKALNKSWIEKYFKMEEMDYKSLDNPESYILNRGGAILVALYKDKPVGVCALIKPDDEYYDFELAKMAVSSEVQGMGIGKLLGQAVIEHAKSLGAKKIYLESNTVLKAAISLYQKLNFKKIPGRVTPYERSNIQMELEIT